MKGHFILGATMCVCAVCHAQDMGDILKKWDVSRELTSRECGTPADFWSAYTETNEEYKKFAKDIKKGKGAEKEAISIVAGLPRYNSEYRPEVVEMDSLATTLSERAGIPSGIELCFAEDGMLNAFATQSENHPVIVLSTRWFGTKGVDDGVLTAVLAHETAHTVLQHQLQHFYKIAKDKRETKAKVAIKAAGDAIGAIGGALAGNKDSSADYQARMNDYIRKVTADMMQSDFRYSREFEHIADLLAYRFLDWAGYGGENMVKALLILEANQAPGSMQAFSDDFDDHPSTRERIAFLRAAKDHEPKAPKTKNPPKNSTGWSGYDDIY